MKLHGLIGIALLLLLSFLLSSQRRRVSIRLLVAGLGLQLLIALACLHVVPSTHAANLAAGAVAKLVGFCDSGIGFVFGELADTEGSWGHIFFVRVLPVIIYFSALMSILHYLGVIQRLVSGLAWVLRKAFGTTLSGVEGVVAAANVFIGHTQVPLLIRPYLEGMTRSQLMLLMTTGFATVSAELLVVYAGFLGAGDDAMQKDFVRHLLIASLMSAPAAVVIAKILEPETETVTVAADRMTADREEYGRNLLDSACRGAVTGMRLATSIAAVLIALVSLLAMVNWLIAKAGAWNGHDVVEKAHLASVELLDSTAAGGQGVLAGPQQPPLTLQSLLGHVLRVPSWTLGIEWEETRKIGALIGEEIIATEFLAYKSLGEQTAGLSERSVLLATYALCGFASIPSIAVQLGALAALAPGRRKVFVSLGYRAMLGGAMASWLTACVIGLFI